MSEKLYKKTLIDYNDIKELKSFAKLELGWDKVVGEMWNSSNALMRCEIENRGKNRARILNMKEKEKIYERREKAYHRMSVGHLRKTLDLIDESLKALGDDKIKQLEKIKDNLKPIRGEALDFFKESLVEEDLVPETTGEVVEIYDELVKIVETGGFSGLVHKIKKNINELIEVRSDESKNRGRDESHSLLTWFKWVLLAIMVGVGIALLIACLIWHGCKWIISIVSSIGDLVILCLRVGC